MASSDSPLSGDFAKLQSQIEELRHDMSKMLGTARKGVRHLKKEGMESIENSIEQVEDKLREKPILSAAIALGIGFVVGTFLFRR